MPKSGSFHIEGGEASFWILGTFAPQWFADAQVEAKNGGFDARRREIIFSVAAAESYLLEWVRDDVLKQKYDEIIDYFPARKRRGIKEKWKDIPKELLKKKKIKSSPDLGGETWADFCTLVKFRNGLLHASASRPESKDGSGPSPSSSQRNELSAGWAVKVVRDLILDLNDAAGTTPPDWLNSFE